MSGTEITAEAYSEKLIENVRTNMIELTTLSQESKETGIDVDTMTFYG